MFATVTEGRMAEVMSQTESFGEILIQTKSACNCPPNLRNLDAVGEANPEMIAIGGDKHLCLVAKTPKRD
jgi:hypothetical protein